ncbi:hypothetical protein [Thiomonas sp.]
MRHKRTLRQATMMVYLTNDSVHDGTPDAYRRFQEELGVLDRTAEQRAAVTPLKMKMTRAKSETLALRQRFSLSVADVIAFFPPKEGEFLRQIIANPEFKARRVTKAQTSSSR